MMFSIMRRTKNFRDWEERGIHLDGILGIQFLYATKATIDFADLVVRMDKNRVQKDLMFPIGFSW